ncbi:MAG: hypothetical protein M3Y54_20785 [Bacteroidota bacterium]|nr:hypothetical protein [Bacteroidota bacterium]
MKKSLLIPSILGTALSASAQTSAPAPARPWAVGVEAGSHLAGTAPAQPRLQVQPGLFARYQPGRLGGRVGLNFGQQTTPADQNCADCLTGPNTSRTLGLRLGGQYAVLPQLPWLYTFLDVAYHHTRAEGRYTGGFCGCLDYTTTQTTRTLGTSAGIGASVRVVSRLYIGSELYYEGFAGRRSYRSADNRFGGQTTGSASARGHAPAVRLQAAVAF